MGSSNRLRISFTYSGLSSAAVQRMFSMAHASNVAPDPANGSSTGHAPA